MPSRDPDMMLFHVVKSTKVFNCCAELQVLVVMMSESQYPTIVYIIFQSYTIKLTNAHM